MAKMEIERGLSGLGLDSQCLKLGEEVGELFDAAGAFSSNPSGPTTVIAEECVDVTILLASIANRTNVILTDAVRARALHETGRVIGLGSSLGGVQDYAAGTDLATLGLADLCLRLGHETGELFRAIRKRNGNPTDPHGRTVAIADTCARITILLAAIANLIHVTLEDAWRAKEERNNNRTWR
ncbi:nucleoside triphosphate pyrophosphohydrolase family protein [Streptosporangium soli]|nr:hypothetical protein [Streptosporangium sp. KLBMP 9127]